MKKYVFLLLLLMTMLSCQSVDEDTETDNKYGDGYKSEHKW
ncbi:MULTISPECIES: hypothetical protein [Borrelia]|nr:MULTISPECIES: hypothetical protein [Borrelia]